MEKLKHNKGEGLSWAESDLFVRWKEIPHLCSDPQCPGDINRRKLEAAEEMAEILKDQHRENFPSHSVFYIDAEGNRVCIENSLYVEDCKICDLLSTWEKAGKGKG